MQQSVCQAALLLRQAKRVNVIVRRKTRERGHENAVLRVQRLQRFQRFLVQVKPHRLLHLQCSGIVVALRKKYFERGCARFDLVAGDILFIKLYARYCLHVHKRFIAVSVERDLVQEAHAQAS